MIYKMDDGTIVKTEKSAIIAWAENRLGERETLYKSRRGRYWIERMFPNHGLDYAEWISKRAAAEWLTSNGKPLTEDLLEAPQ